MDGTEQLIHSIGDALTATPKDHLLEPCVFFSLDDMLLGIAPLMED